MLSHFYTVCKCDKPKDRQTYTTISVLTSIFQLNLGQVASSHWFSSPPDMEQKNLGQVWQKLLPFLLPNQQG